MRKTLGILGVLVACLWASLSWAACPTSNPQTLEAYVFGCPVQSGALTSTWVMPIIQNSTTAPTAATVGLPLSSAGISLLLDPIGSTQGGILYRGSTAWSYLAPGTSGQFLETLGAGANPQWAPASGGGTVTSVSQGTGMSFSANPITTTGTINLANTAVTAGSYTNTNLTVDAQGRITAAANGSAGGTATQSIGTFGGTQAALTMASPSPAVSSNTAYYRVCGIVPSGLTGASPSTLAVGTASALPIRKQNVSGLVALVPGDFTGQIQYMCFAVDSTASFWVYEIPQSIVYNNKGTYTITVADCEQGAVFVNTSGTNALTLPTSASLGGGACGITIIDIGNVATLTAQGSDTINGLTGGTYNFRANAFSLVTLSGTAFTAPTEGVKPDTLTWAEGQNLSTNPRIMRIADAGPIVISNVACAVAVAAGGTATIQLAYSASATFSSPTNIGTTCNANSATIQSGLLSAQVVVPTGSVIGFTATGAGWSSSVGTGVIQFGE